MKKNVLFTLILTALGTAPVFAQSGTLDTDFGTGGFVSTAILDDAEPQSIAIQSDDKTILAGITEDATDEYLAMVRYNSDGTPDNTFGTAGIVTLQGIYEWVSIGLQTDGKILAAGTSQGSSGTDDITLIRFNTDGTLDNTFGTGGIATVDIGTSESADASEFIYDLAVQADGKVVVAGVYYANDGSNDYDDVLVARFDNSGNLDATFGTNGYVITEYVSGTIYHAAYSVAIQNDGKIVVGAGAYDEMNDASTVTVLRYNTDGSADNSFGTSGVAGEIPDSEAGSGLALQNDGKILISGQAASNNGDFLVARYNTDGTLDNAFGSAGVATLDIGSGTNDEALDLTVQSDGKIVAVGSSETNAALVRIQTDAVTDNTFGNGGKVIDNFGFSAPEATCVALQSDGRIVLGARHTGAGDFIAARYFASGTGGIESQVNTPFTVFPNPANAYTQINNLPENAVITISDLTGKVLYQKSTSTKETLVGTADLPNGTYLLSILANESVTTQKLVIKR